jgi:hypothetical protein
MMGWKGLRKTKLKTSAKKTAHNTRLVNASRRQVMLDEPTLNILRKVHSNRSEAIRLLAKWYMEQK